MEYKIEVKGSTGNIYTIYIYNKKKLSMLCDCMAGLNRMTCKHKEMLLFGNYSILVNENDKSILEELNKSKNIIELKDKYISLKNKEKEISKLMKDLNKMKKELKEYFG